jgi:hypothetical protein
MPLRRTTALSRTPTFEPTKCCALREWRLQRAAPQHREVAVNGRSGPVVKLAHNVTCGDFLVEFVAAAIGDDSERL